MLKPLALSVRSPGNKGQLSSVGSQHHLLPCMLLAVTLASLLPVFAVELMAIIVSLT